MTRSALKMMLNALTRAWWTIDISHLLHFQGYTAKKKVNGLDFTSCAVTDVIAWMWSKVPRIKLRENYEHVYEGIQCIAYLNKTAILAELTLGEMCIRAPFNMSRELPWLCSLRTALPSNSLWLISLWSLVDVVMIALDWRGSRALNMAGKWRRLVWLELASTCPRNETFYKTILMSLFLHMSTRY